jgi:hypothetical protein
MAAGIRWRKAMATQMSRSEKIVAGLAVAMLVAGFATGVLAKSVNSSLRVDGRPAHVAVIAQLQ